MSTEQEGLVGLGRHIADAAKRLVLLEIELVKARAVATAKRFAIGAGLLACSLLSALLFVVFLLGTVAEGSSLEDNYLILAFAGGVPLTAVVVWLAGRMPKILDVLSWIVAGVLAVACIGSLIAFMVDAIIFQGTDELRRGWAITAMTLFVVMIATGGVGAWLILRAISGGKATASDVKRDVTWAVDDVKSRRWHG